MTTAATTAMTAAATARKKAEGPGAQDWSDLELVGVDGSVLRLHKAVGAKVSEVIALAAQSGETHIRCDAACLDARGLRRLKEYLYHNRCSCSSFAEAEQLCDIGVVLGMPTLVREALGSMRLSISPGAALRAHRRMQAHGTLNDVRRAAQYVVRRFACVAHSDAWARCSPAEVLFWAEQPELQQQSPQAVFMALLRWVHAQAAVAAAAPAEGAPNAIAEADLQQLHLGALKLREDERRACVEAADEFLALAQEPQQQGKRDCLRFLRGSLATRPRDRWHTFLETVGQVTGRSLLSGTAWALGGELAAARTGLSLATHGSNVLAFGGLDTTSATSAFPLVERQELFTTIRQCGSKPLMYAPASLITDTSAVQITSSIVGIVGGCNIVADEVLSRARLYNARFDTWATLPDLPEPRAGCVLAWLCLDPNKYYMLVVAGGSNKRQRHLDSVVALPVQCTADAGDVTWTWSTTWLRLPKLSEPRYCAASCVVAGRSLYVIGGVSEHDAVSATVETLTLPTSVADVQGLILALTNEQLAWAPGPALPSPRHSFGAFAISTPSSHQLGHFSSSILVVGGRDHFGRDLDSTAILHVGIGALNAWTATDQVLVHPRSSFGYTVLNSTEAVLIIGGGVNGDNVLSSLETLALQF